MIGKISFIESLNLKGTSPLPLSENTSSSKMLIKAFTNLSPMQVLIIIAELKWSMSTQKKSKNMAPPVPSIKLMGFWFLEDLETEERMGKLPLQPMHANPKNLILDFALGCKLLSSISHVTLQICTKQIAPNLMRKRPIQSFRSWKNKKRFNKKA